MPGKKNASSQKQSRHQRQLAQDMTPRMDTDNDQAKASLASQDASDSDMEQGILAQLNGLNSGSSEDQVDLGGLSEHPAPMQWQHGVYDTDADNDHLHPSGDDVDDEKQVAPQHPHQGPIRQPLPNTASPEDLVQLGQEAKPAFDATLENLMDRTGANQDAHQVRKGFKKDSSKSKKANNDDWKAQHGHAHYEHPEYSGPGPLKKKERIGQKTQQKYGGDVGKVLDVVRGTMTYNSMQELHEALKTVWNLQKEWGFEIVRGKQTYEVDKKGSADVTMYGDVKFNIKLEDTEHICELQFSHTTMIDAKAKAHKHYKVLRDVETKELSGEPLTKEDKTARFGAIHGNHMAYSNAHIQLSKEKGFDEVVKDVNALGAFLSSGGKGALPKGFEDVFGMSQDGQDG